MKKIAVFVVAMTLILNCTYTVHHYFSYETTRPIVISERVGKTIDAEEQGQFGLFLWVGDFKFATFYGIEDGEND